MVAPHWEGNPNRYQPNPADDRAIAGLPNTSNVYLQLAVAIEAITDDIPAEAWRYLNRDTRRAIRAAESALRRAALTTVMYADPTYPAVIDPDPED